MMKHGWSGYRKYAWGADELKPCSKSKHNQNIFGESSSMGQQNLGITIIDSLDTLYLMGLAEEFDEATKWVKNSFNPNLDTKMSLFEINIRVVGGFLAAFTLSRDRVILLLLLGYSRNPL